MARIYVTAANARGVLSHPTSACCKSVELALTKNAYSSGEHTFGIRIESARLITVLGQRRLAQSSSETTAVEFTSAMASSSWSCARLLRKFVPALAAAHGE